MLAYKLKHKFKRENQVILLMITDGEIALDLKSLPTFDGEKCLNLAVKSLSALLRGMTSNHNRDFYCLNCFHSYSTKHGLEKHERVCNDHDYCHVKMPKEDNKILESTKLESHSKLQLLFLLI